MDDEPAYMALVTTNNQKELSLLEIGTHALNFVGLEQGKKGGGLASYAEKIGKSAPHITIYRQAARVFAAVNLLHQCNEFHDKTQHLATIHALPEPEWRACVDLLLEHGWSVKDTQAAVERIKAVLLRSVRRVAGRAAAAEGRGERQARSGCKRAGCDAGAQR